MTSIGLVGIALFIGGFLLAESLKEKERLISKGCTCKNSFMFIILDEDCPIHSKNKDIG